MKRKIFAVMLAVVFVLSQANVADAKGFSRSFGGGKSFSKSFGSTFKSKSGYSGSSKSSKGLFSGGSKKASSSASSGSGYSGSSSRSVPGSYSTGSSAKSASASSSKKSAYMQDAYKKQTSSANYSTYKQKLNTEQQKVYDSAMNSNFKVNNRMNFEDSINTRAQRVSNMNSRPVYVNVRPGLFSGPMTWGMGFAGMWDMWFLMHASSLFWYHHWNEISPYRDNFDEQKFEEMEARVKELEQQNNGVRDPNYMDPDVDPDLQLSKEYQEKNLDKVYYTDKYSKPESDPVSTIIVILLVGGVLFIVLSKAARSKPKKTYNSRIY